MKIGLVERVIKLDQGREQDCFEVLNVICCVIHL